MAAPTQNFLMIEEINSDAGAPQMLKSFPLSKTVKELKIAIATMMGEPNEWQSIMVIFLGQEMENENRTLLSHKIGNSDTIFFVRSIEPPPPYIPNNSGFPDDKKDTPVQALPSTIIIKTVFFKNIEGRSMTLEDLPISMTIGQVKDKLGTEKHMENDSTVRFTFGGKTLDEKKTLMDYNVQNLSTIDIVWRMPGGLVTLT
ncbi:hypothetical protein QBC37DRAFT_327001 [Rhypophila decipiens]|uniref:Ubiquitin-like domain-containing protein n=1 Tax=Rhypophila decipiens TaxID=261697 RepID=A0AAN6XXZ3_9PEZI|nr:hypothetical protein QBC37DRAFT_327001 [Rhypophila decipiens]